MLAVQGSSYYDAVFELLSTHSVSLVILFITSSVFVVKSLKKPAGLSPKILNPGPIKVPPADGIDTFLEQHEQQYGPLSCPAHVKWKSGSKGEQVPSL